MITVFAGDLIFGVFTILSLISGALLVYCAWIIPAVPHDEETR